MKINKHILNISLWITLILSYILPYKFVKDFYVEIGFPFPFFTMYTVSFSKGMSILKSSHLRIGALILNVIVVYLVVYCGKVILDKVKLKSDSKRS